MSDSVSRLNGALENRYVIERELGEGGMATVYLAKDLKHNRNVALKVLKPELAAVVGAERFLAEIETTANLTHPNILPLHDSGEADSFLYYVMPYIEGESLRDRLDREHQLPVDEAVKITTDLAEALDYAHRHKIIHRDIKPANILLHEGRPLIADFGIALAVGAAGGGRLTETGLSLGTPFYMSPEQATGDQFVGASTDTYALGSVLYEMLTGDPPYVGKTAQAVLGQIISSRPISATEKRASIPANVDAALRKALEKLPADRFKSSQEFATALGDEHFRYGEAVVGVGASDAGPWKRSTMAFASLAAVLALSQGWSLLRPEPPESVTRVSVLMGVGQSFASTFGSLDLSADGSFMVYKGVDEEGQLALMMRRWDALSATPIRNAGNAYAPTISPDDREVAFHTSGGSVRVVPLDGGAVRILTESASCCPTWSREGDWVYYRDSARGLSRVPATGGPSEVVTRVDTAAGDVSHSFAQVLPGSSSLLYQVRGSASGQRIQALDLETGETKDLTPGQAPRYVSTGHLLFVNPTEGTLLAALFDVTNLELMGAVEPVVEGVLQSQGLPYFDVSESDRLVYRAGVGGGLHTPVWVDRDGTVQEVDPGWAFPTDAFMVSLAISPGGTRLVASIIDADGTADLYVKQLDSGPLSRLTFEGTENLRPRWSRDAEFVTFVSNRAGQRDLWRKRADGSGSAELVLDRERPIQEFAYTPDGTWLVFVESDGLVANADIFAIRPELDSLATPLVTDGVRATEISLSPDGRWLSYTWRANPEDRAQVYVRPFPDVDAGLWQVSTTYGDESVWAHSGRELFYQGESVGGTQMVAEINVDPSFSVGQQRVLFSSTDYQIGNGSAGYDISPDDQRLMLMRSLDLDSQLILVDNFFEELKERVPN